MQENQVCRECLLLSNQGFFKSKQTGNRTRLKCFALLRYNCLMRRGDCCLLEWAKVDLKARFISVKTAKTGQTVSIPIFPLLWEELDAWAKNRKPNEIYVFPEQAKMYLENPDGITWRVRKVLAAAGFRDDETEESKSTANETAKQNDAHSAPLEKNNEPPVCRGEIR
ncbi:MAG TPA: tyrosine-type recombinase/integrase [bacterium]|nr:tyrosine-type recombinase/integrase [bacterium]